MLGRLGGSSGCCLPGPGEHLWHHLPLHPHIEAVNVRVGWPKLAWRTLPRVWWSVARSLTGGQWLLVHPRSQYWVQPSSISLSTPGWYSELYSASLQTVLNSDKWLVCQRVALSPRRILKGPSTGTSWSTTRGKDNFCTWGRATPCTGIC